MGACTGSGCILGVPDDTSEFSSHQQSQELAYFKQQATSLTLGSLPGLTQGHVPSASLGTGTATS